MGHAAAIGERSTIEGYALAGAEVIVAEDPAAVRDAWERLAVDVDLVLLTPAAADALAGRVPVAGDRLVAVLP